MYFPSQGSNLALVKGLKLCDRPFQDRGKKTKPNNIKLWYLARN